MDISKSTGYKDFLWAVELNHLCLELVGLWPTINNATKRRIDLDIRVGSVLILMIFISGVPSVCALVRVWGNLELMIDNLRLTLPLILVSLKLVILRWKQIVLSSVLNMMAEDWMALKLSVERDVMIKYAKTSRLFVICTYAVTLSAFILLIVPSCIGQPTRYVTNLTDRNKPLPMQTYYFYDTDKSPQFELTFLTQALTLILGLYVYLSVDAFLVLLVLHVCGQLENLKHRLVNLVSCNDFDRALSRNIVTHIRIIRFAYNIEDIFTFIMLALVVHFAIIFCIYGFQTLIIITERRNINDVGILQVSYIVFIVTIVFIQMFFYCYVGDLITEKCEAIYRALCDLEWYNLESGRAKHIIILLLRTQKPPRITAGRIIPLTITTFCSFVKTSVGYISFLLAQA
ncbi:Odorant receptor 100 [Nylanderia fulva]|uniref:Odorant receptor n=1 Tax=Nylanderia fulva TaxID=613905 RepID=A0A6G1LNY4_9HYME|nr:odorant receptor 49b-like [Nylanderia fulva]KAF3054306.1 Odorant receptor 100 [Nylanderia fulva]